MTKLELLSPARNRQTAIAAIDCGADAVYIGYKAFGARAAACNSLNDIRQVVDYAHPFGVKVYITMNTILFDDELQQARTCLEELSSIGVDAVIIQDMAYLKLNDSSVLLHASTQMNSFTKEKVRFLYQSGIKRVVLARELSLEQIRRIHDYCPQVEIECFVHGALCCGISGECYLSLYRTNRSGNRGECAQSCRTSYTLVNSEGRVLQKDRYLLSTRDLDASVYLGGMIEAGVSSFKIEGRLKDENYVRNVTAHYNRLLNEYIASHHGYERASSGRTDIRFEPDVERSFNRGFTTFYLGGRKERTGNMFSTKSMGKHVGEVLESEGRTLKLKTRERFACGDGLVFLNGKGELEGVMVNGVRGNVIDLNKAVRIPVGTALYRNRDTAFEKALAKGAGARKLEVDMFLGKGKLCVRDMRGNEVEVETGSGLPLARNAEDYEKKLGERLGKTGDTVFVLRNFSYVDDRRYFFTISRLNDLRRRALDLLYEKIKADYRVEKQPKVDFDVPYVDSSVDYRANVSNLLSEKFYSDKGVKVGEYALEKEMKKGEKELMRSRNCIRYNLGQCLKKDRVSKEYSGKLFLLDNSHRYRLEFDCSNCLMSVFSCD